MQALQLNFIPVYPRMDILSNLRKKLSHEAIRRLKSMFKYVVTFGNGSKLTIRANSPKEASAIASKIGVVSHIKYLR